MSDEWNENQGDDNGLMCTSGSIGQPVGLINMMMHASDSVAIALLNSAGNKSVGRGGGIPGATQGAGNTVDQSQVSSSEPSYIKDYATGWDPAGATVQAGDGWIKLASRNLYDPTTLALANAQNGNVDLHPGQYVSFNTSHVPNVDVGKAVLGPIWADQGVILNNSRLIQTRLDESNSTESRLLIERWQDRANEIAQPENVLNSTSMDETDPDVPGSYHRNIPQFWDSMSSGLKTSLHAIETGLPEWWAENGYHANQLFGCYGNSTWGWDTKGACMTGDFKFFPYLGVQAGEKGPSWTIGTTIANTKPASDFLQNFSGTANLFPIMGKVAIGGGVSPNRHSSLDPRNWGLSEDDGATYVATIGSPGASVTYGLTPDQMQGSYRRIVTGNGN
ncbi:MAG: hypothetical protein JO142_00790 [Burkholderiales bacterium]|nr:hypothetical protein [Burkholderiales bacterium]